MGKNPIIQSIQLTRYRFPFKDVGHDLAWAMGAFYEPGGQGGRGVLGIQIHTDLGVTGEYMSIAPGTFEQIQMFASFLIGKNALERELFYNQAKAILRKNDRMGIGPIDIALWDLAGKLYDAPIYRLLGGYRDKLPAYASTYHADREPDGLSSPETFADFAEQCLEMGYKGFKLHTWADGNIEREIETIHAVGKRVGGKMALMIDPCCAYNTYADTLRVGLACDEENFYWYEDPMKDGGVSLYAHRQLRQAIKTPLLQGEHIHLVEAHADMALAEATDLGRADPEYDGGITGVMKVAHSAEGFGMDVELHIAGPAQRHCMAAMRNSNFYEMGLVHPKLPNIASPPVYADGYADELDSIDENGCVDVPQGPGLGVVYDWSGIDKHKVDELIIDR
ncbi:MAG: enolase C-terminal domain-like protein [SAR202 cluster bacterium]|jgi:L-alanine-DL-glutamate epimerase-like enolase superfamily enzyme|nr:enolase C-terminal domain-like protein [SAR202 cluster bacterium]MDP6713291.1 enolase C-terminal domain-like protein [SAR202 cluster bacterium]